MRAIEAIIGALTDLGMARAYLGIDKGTEREDDLLQFDINAATADIQAYTGRLLKTRSYSGSGVLRTTGDGTGRFVARQYPVTAVTKIEWRDSTGTATALDITGIRVQGNLIVTPADGAPFGSPVEITGTAGYLAGYDGEHDAALTTLEGICLRLVEIKRSDRTKHVGRGIEVKTGEGTAKYEATRIPGDLQALLAPFRRIGTG